MHAWLEQSEGWGLDLHIGLVAGDSVKIGVMVSTTKYIEEEERVGSSELEYEIHVQVYEQAPMYPTRPHMHFSNYIQMICFDDLREEA